MSNPRCRLCWTELTHTFVDLGMSPPCESYLSADQLDEGETFYPLHVRVCPECLLVQLPAYIPAGCAHGFQALTDPADTSYRIDRAYDPDAGLTIAHDDPELAIPWPLPVTGMSEADRCAEPLSALGDRLREVEAVR